MAPAALFLDIDQTPFKVHIVEIDVSDRRPAHAGFDQRVNDGPDAVRRVAFAHGPLFVPEAVAILGAATDYWQGKRFFIDIVPTQQYCCVKALP